MQALQSLSITIYTQLATAYIATLDRPLKEPDPAYLGKLARESNVAARAYFEGLGIAQFKADPPDARDTPQQQE